MSAIQSCIDFTAARSARDQGMRQAIDHAKDLCLDWPERAYAFLVEYARHNAYFSAYHVTDAAEASRTFPDPPTGKSWGSVYTKAQREGVIAQDGCDRHPKRHASICIRYRSLVFAGSAA